MATYDKHYLKQDYFGMPYEHLLSFFKDYPERGLLCDLGAGQGRDSIPLYNMGYDVNAVDISKIGLEQIQRKCPQINTINKDIYSFDITKFDFVLLDSMVHFYKNDINKESKLIKRIINELKTGGVLVNCMIKSEKDEKILLDIIETSGIKHTVLDNRYVEYPEYDSLFYFLALKKC